ncbi:GatB/YqeY domain-containing protein [Lactarius indigo]|nr:GatB/YqeY domain-containing protein [Lactarius indigo]
MRPLVNILCHKLTANATDTGCIDLRTRLLDELKTSLKSVLSEVYSADKVSNGKKIDSSGIALLIRKAYARRLDSAVQFNQASRPDLAGKEQQEADLLARFLPPLLPEAEVDRILQDVMTEQVSKAQDDPRKSIGRIFKAFYSRVDRASVDPDLLKRRAEALLSS